MQFLKLYMALIIGRVREVNGRDAFYNGREATTKVRLYRRLFNTAKALDMRESHDQASYLGKQAEGNCLTSLPRTRVLRRLMSRDCGIIQSPTDH